MKRLNMAQSTSPKGSSGDFAKKVQRQLSRSKEKVRVCKFLFFFFSQIAREQTYYHLVAVALSRLLFFSAGAAKAGKDRGEQRRPIRTLPPTVQ